MYRDDSGIFSLVIKRFGFTNTSVQNFAIRISSVKTVSTCLRKLKVVLNAFNIDVSSLLMSSLRAIVICQKYCGNRMISSQIHLSAPLLNIRRCTLWVSFQSSSIVQAQIADMTQRISSVIIFVVNLSYFLTYLISNRGLITSRTLRMLAHINMLLQILVFVHQIR